QPQDRLDVRGDVGAVETPGERLADRPAARTFTVETEVGGQPIKSVEEVASRVPELVVPHDRGYAELTLPEERLRVDHEPWFALSGKHVVAVQILMEQDRLTLCHGQRAKQLDHFVEKTSIEGFARARPFAGQGIGPPFGLGRERPERLRFPSPE